MAPSFGSSESAHCVPHACCHSGCDATPGDLAAPTRDDLCAACAMGKQHRLPFPDSASATFRPLELLHMDLVGKLEHQSLGGARYFSTLYDDFSAFSVVLFHKFKSDVPAAVIAAIKQLEQQTGHTVQRIRTDRGSEYLNATVRAFLADKGIVHEAVPPYTPQQNGKAERLNRTLVECARTMLADTGLPGSMWGELINAACYLRNRCAVAGRELVPHQLFYGTAPDLSMLRVWVIGICADARPAAC